jgi:hypothetical protein
MGDFGNPKIEIVSETEWSMGNPRLVGFAVE